MDDKLIFEITINGNVICKRYWELTRPSSYENFVKVMSILNEQCNIIKTPYKTTFTDDVNVYFKYKDDVMFHHIIQSKRSNFRIDIKPKLKEIMTLLGAEKIKI